MIPKWAFQITKWIIHAFSSRLLFSVPQPQPLILDVYTARGVPQLYSPSSYPIISRTQFLFFNIQDTCLYMISQVISRDSLFVLIFYFHQRGLASIRGLYVAAPCSRPITLTLSKSLCLSVRLPICFRASTLVDLSLFIIISC